MRSNVMATELGRNLGIIHAVFDYVFTGAR